MFVMPDLPQMLAGESVVVRRPSLDYDEHMEEVSTWEEEAVQNVVVAPGSTSDVTDATRPHGTRATWSLAFPKPYDRPLRGCRVVVRGHEHAVIGDPQPNPMENCPTPWWYVVEVEDVDG